MIPSFEASSFALFLFIDTYLYLLVFSAPNPPPPRDHGVRDRLHFMTRPAILLFGKAALLAVSLYHILLVLTFPNPPSALCRHAPRLDYHFFTWTFYSAACIVLAIAGALVRLSAFKQLGPNFTFQLARPRELVTTGLYKYVQHPSYLGLAMLGFANFAIFMRRRAAVACWLPMSWWIADDQMGLAVEGVVALVFLLMSWYVVGLRVMDEEMMLEKAFGQEWQEYNARTKRYIPGVI
jgi:protein-S-isoprenylcysteine O-methyltransferase Ste14